MDDEVHLILIDQATDLSQLQLQLDPVDPITNVQPLNSSEIKEMNPPNNMTLQVSTNKETPLLMDHQNLATRKNSPNPMTQPVRLGTRTSNLQDYSTETYKPDEHTEERNQVILNDQTGILEEIDWMNPKVTVKDIQIDNGVNNLLEALNQDQSTKEEIISYINQEDDVVDLEIDDWLTMDSWDNTPAIEEMISPEFENL